MSQSIFPPSRAASVSAEPLRSTTKSRGRALSHLTATLRQPPAPSAPPRARAAPSERLPICPAR